MSPREAKADTSVYQPKGALAEETLPPMGELDSGTIFQEVGSNQAGLGKQDVLEGVPVDERVDETLKPEPSDALGADPVAQDPPRLPQNQEITAPTSNEVIAESSDPDSIGVPESASDKAREPGVSDSSIGALLRNPSMLWENPVALLKNPLTAVLLITGLLVLIALMVMPILLIQRRRAAKLADSVEELDFEPVVQQHSKDMAQVLTADEDQHTGAWVPPVPGAPNSDPLERVDLLIAVGNYREAESTVREALADDPTNTTLAVKLLDILFANNDAKGFLEEAEIMYERFKNAPGNQWEHVAKMGKELWPNEPLFAETKVFPERTGVETDSQPGMSAATESLPESSGSLDFEIFSPTDDADESSAPVAEKDSLETSEGLDWQPPESTNVDETATTVADKGKDDLDAQLRGLDFDFDDLLGPESQASNPASTSEVGKKEDSLDLDDAWTGETQVDEDLDAQLRSLGFDPVKPAADNSSQTRNNASDAGAGADNDFFNPANTIDTAPVDDGLTAELSNLDFDLAQEFPVDGQPQDRSAEHNASLSSGVGAEPEEGELDGNQFVETKLDLALAYLEMEDAAGASSLLDEVLKEGNSSQKQRAEELLQRVRKLKA